MTHSSVKFSCIEFDIFSLATLVQDQPRIPEMASLTHPGRRVLASRLARYADTRHGNEPTPRRRQAGTAHRGCTSANDGTAREGMRPTGKRPEPWAKRLLVIFVLLLVVVFLLLVLLFLAVFLIFCLAVLLLLFLLLLHTIIVIVIVPLTLLARFRSNAR